MLAEFKLYDTDIERKLPMVLSAVTIDPDDTDTSKVEYREQAIGFDNDALHLSVPDIIARLSEDNIAPESVIERAFAKRENRYLGRYVPGGFEFKKDVERRAISVVITPKGYTILGSTVLAKKVLSFGEANQLLQDGDSDMHALLNCIATVQENYGVGEVNFNGKEDEDYAGKTTTYMSRIANELAAEYFSELKIPGIYRVIQTGNQKHYSSRPVPSNIIDVESYMSWTRPGFRLADTINNMQYSSFEETGQPLFESDQIDAYVRKMNSLKGMR